jgi:hypothetical protein
VIRCIDCIAEGVTTVRPIDPSSGPRSPRCATHVRARKRKVRESAHARRVETHYEISAADYWLLFAAQGGKCAICRVATGKTKRLAVDHDHELAKTHDHPVDRGCRRCIRGLLCSRCNRWGVPLFLETVLRAINYLSDPPARKVFVDA